MKWTTTTDPKAKGKMLEVSLILHSTILILKNDRV
jgi:hypothetical protein